MANTMISNPIKENSHLMIQRWLKKYYPLEHTSIAYVGMYGVWDVMGRNELDNFAVVEGRTEHLVELKQRLCDAIDAEIARREKITAS